MRQVAWYDRIRQETEKPEYQTAIIKILDRSLVTEGEYNFDTGEWDGAVNPEDATVYEGRARIITTRWGVDRNEDKFANPDTLMPVRIQLPRDDLPGMVRKGCIVVIFSAPNQALVGRPMSVTMDFHGSSAASRTIQCRISGDAIDGGE